MKIETKIPCPECGTVIDVEGLKDLIITKIRVFAEEEL